MRNPICAGDHSAGGGGGLRGEEPSCRLLGNLSCTSLLSFRNEKGGSEATSILREF